MTKKWRVECWNCDGTGLTPGCFEDCCSGADCDPEDPINCCNPRDCDVCHGGGGYVVTELSEDNRDTAVPVE